MNTYPEGTSFSIGISLYDEDSAAVIPSTIRYRIDCLTSKKQVRDWTDITPASSFDIAITPDDNAIQVERDRLETRELILQTNYGTPTQQTQTRRWQVSNLQGVS